MFLEILKPVKVELLENVATPSPWPKRALRISELDMGRPGSAGSEAADNMTVAVSAANARLNRL